MDTQAGATAARTKALRSGRVGLWPYHILELSDQELAQDLVRIMTHFKGIGYWPDLLVFVPQAGCHLRDLLLERMPNCCDVAMFSVRRACSLRRPNVLQKFIFRRRTLADIFRHVEVLLRLVKFTLKLRHNRHVEGDADSEVIGKRILIIDDSVDTGSTMRIISGRLIEAGAQEVRTACISNHMLPRKVKVDYAVHEYALLRTPNSRDYYAA